MQVKKIDTSDPMQIIARLAKFGDVIWLTDSAVTSAHQVYVSTSIQDDYNLVNKIGKRKTLQILDEGVVEKTFLLPSGATSVRSVKSTNRYKLFENSADRIYVYLTNSPSDISSTSAQEIKSGKVSLTKKQLEVWQLIFQNITGPFQGLLILCIVAFWENNIFPIFNTLVELEDVFRDYYSKWIEQDDIVSIENLGKMLYMNSKSLEEFSRDNMLYLPKIKEIWKNFTILSGQLLPDIPFKRETWQSTSMTQFFNSVYSNKSVHLDSTHILSNSVIHTLSDLPTGSGIIPLIQRQNDKGVIEIDIYFKRTENDEQSAIPIQLSTAGSTTPTPATTASAYLSSATGSAPPTYPSSASATYTSSASATYLSPTTGSAYFTSTTYLSPATSSAYFTPPTYLSPASTTYLSPTTDSTLSSTAVETLSAAARSLSDTNVKLSTEQRDVISTSAGPSTPLGIPELPDRSTSYSSTTFSAYTA